MNTSGIVQKLWNYCNVLRDDGMSYGDYVEQLTYLLFLKMADERTRQPLLRCSTFRHPWRSQAPYHQKSPVPEKYRWPPSPRPSLASGRGGIVCNGDALFDHCRHTLEALGSQKGLLGLIFNKSQNKFQDPAKLWRLNRGFQLAEPLSPESGCRGQNAIKP